MMEFMKSFGRSEIHLSSLKRFFIKVQPENILDQKDCTKIYFAKQMKVSKWTLDPKIKLER